MNKKTIELIVSSIEDLLEYEKRQESLNSCFLEDIKDLQERVKHIEKDIAPF